MQLVQRQGSWDPFRELEELSSRVNRLFGLTRSAGAATDNEGEALAITDWAPLCNISETEKDYRICAELPNVNKDNVRVTLENGVLTIQGERKEEKDEKDAKFHRRELVFGSFLRRFSMPDDADESRVEATFKNGMLNVVINKAKAKQAKAKEITVH